MAHKTLIGGTAYEISGGKTLVGGTAYSIGKGKTLVEGTEREIAFSFPITVNITGSGNNNMGYITINGTKYYSAQTLVIESGTEITFVADAQSSKYRTSAKINLDGTEVAVGTSSAAATYTFVPESPVVYISFVLDSSKNCYSIDIFSADEDDIAVTITGTGKSGVVYVKINGTSYYSATTLVIEPGTSISVSVTSTSANAIVLDGKTVGTKQGTVYSYTFVPDCSLITIKMSYVATYGNNSINITTS